MATVLGGQVLEFSNMLNNDAEMSAANDIQVDAREKILGFVDKFQSQEHFFRNILCVTGTPQVARLLSLYSVYSRVLNVAGDILEFGVWYGQNLIVMENLRAILEPFNKRRKIIGFDSFEPVGRDTDSINDDYYLGPDFCSDVLDQLSLHEQSNVLGHVRGKHEIMIGDIVETLPEYRRRGRAVSVMMIDVPGEPELQAVFDCAEAHLALGGLLIIDDLNDDIQPEVSTTFLQYQHAYRISPCPFIPSRSIAERVS